MNGEIVAGDSCELLMKFNEWGTQYQMCASLVSFDIFTCKTFATYPKFQSLPEWTKYEVNSGEFREEFEFSSMSPVMKAPGLDFWFKIGTTNEYIIMQDYDVDLYYSRIGDYPAQSISLELWTLNNPNPPEISLKPSIVLEYSTDNEIWYDLLIPMISSEPVYAEQNHVSFMGKEVYYWDKFILLNEKIPLHSRRLLLSSKNSI
mgnify:CR=1 FL=1